MTRGGSERERMVADMARKMSDDVEALMQRNVDVAQHVFGPLEITEMVMRVAASVCGAAIMVAVQIRRPDIEPGELYDLVAEAIARQVRERKQHLPQVLETLEQVRRTRGPRR